MKDWQDEMKQKFEVLLDVFNQYFLTQVVESGETGFDIKDEMLGSMASSCTTLEAALSLFTGTLLQTVLMIIHCQLLRGW